MPKPIALKGGQWTTDRRCDRVRQVDLNSLNWPIGEVLPAKAKKARSYTYKLDLILDQGQQGACVSTGCGHDLAARPGVVSGVTFEWCHREIYHPAQHADEWKGCYLGSRCPIEKGPQYEGTSTLAGFKMMKQLGLIDEYRWALTFEDFVLGVGYHGPAVIGVDWYDGMWDTDENGFIAPTGDIAGGHCVAVIGVKIFRNKDGSVDYLRSYFIIHNSWGPDWGTDGRARMLFIDMMKLWPGGDFGFAVGRRKATLSG